MYARYVRPPYAITPQKVLDVYQTLSLLEGEVWERDYLTTRELQQHVYIIFNFYG